MSTTNAGGSHSHTLNGPKTLAAGSHQHIYTDLVGPDLTARIDALTARVVALETKTPTVKTVAVSSVAGLLAALADDTVDEVVVANGTYHVSPAAEQKADSLWISDRYAARTRPVLVRAATTGGVTFDGGGEQYFGGVTFLGGAHHQTWRGFRWTNGEPTGTGVIVFGGYPNVAPPHHITLLDTVVSGLTGKPLMNGYPIYFSQAALPGPHDLLVDGFTADPGPTSKACLHFYHDTQAGDPAGNFNVQNVVIRNARLVGTPQPVMVWAQSINGLVFEDVVISGAGETAIRYEGGQGVVFRRVVSTGSVQGGFYSSLGANPPGVTFDGCSLG